MTLAAGEVAALTAAIAQVLSQEGSAAAPPESLPAAYRSRWARAGRAEGVQPPAPVSSNGLDWRGVARD